MYQNDLPMSLKSETFNTLCNNFDDVLRSTLRGMVETDQDTAEIGVKVKIFLTEDSAPDFSVAGGQQTREITKPRFEHTVTAVIQRKEKKTGTLSGEYELVYDPDSGRYVMRPIDNGQTNLFDQNGEIIKGEIIEADYTEVPVHLLPEGQRALPGGPQGDNEEEQEIGRTAEDDAELIDTNESGEDSENVDTPFGWLKQFVREAMRISEAMGNFTVRTIENRVVLSSATSETSPFYCPAEKLAPHVGHHIVCIGYGQDKIETISIECQDCNEELYNLNAVSCEDNSEQTDEKPFNAMKVEEVAQDNEMVEDDGYGYENPESDDEEIESDDGCV